MWPGLLVGRSWRNAGNEGCCDREGSEYYELPHHHEFVSAASGRYTIRSIGFIYKKSILKLFLLLIAFTSNMGHVKAVLLPVPIF
jgi:hypothetical protein